MSRDSVRADFMAGLTGAIMAVPQGVAFATIAGLPPQYGLYTAIVVPIIAAIFGSSYHLVSGPTTAISILIFATLSNFAEPGSADFISLAITVTLLAGIYQFLFGLLRLGSLVNFVSHSVITGFTAGSAILIITSQLGTIFGIELENGESFISTWISMLSRIGEANPYTLSIAIITLVTAIICKKIAPKLPNMLFALVAGGALAAYLQNYTDTIRFVGEIPAELPQFVPPQFDLTNIKLLAPEALAIALIGFIEAISIAKSMAAKSGQRLDSNQEFISQGVSNMVGSFFSCFAASGSFTRSGVNFEAGARTPLSAAFAGLILLAIVLLFGPLTTYLPIPAMGGIIMLVGYNLIQINQIKEILRHHRSETAILSVTFFGTLFIDIEFAICLGVMLSLMVFLARSSHPHIPRLTPVVGSDGSKHFEEVVGKSTPECPQIKILRIESPIFFGSVNYIQSQIARINESGVNHIIIVAFGIDSIDLTGAEALLSEHNRLKKQGGGLYFVDHELNHSTSSGHQHLIEDIGKEHFFSSKAVAIPHVYARLDQAICQGCRKKVFYECHGAGPEACCTDDACKKCNELEFV